MIHIEKLLISLITVFPITGIIQRYTTIPNRILFAGITILMFFLLMKELLRHSTKKNCYIVLGLGALIVLDIYDCYITEGALINFNDFMYLPFWCIFFSYLVMRFDNCQKELSRNLNLIKDVVILGNMLILLFRLINSNYFISGRHRLASAVFLLIMELYFYYQKTGNKKILLCAIIPIYAILNCESRTYVIMIAIFFLIAYYRECRKKIHFYLTLIPIGALMAIIAMNSGIGDFFRFRQIGNFDFWGSITSGRTIFWEADINFYKGLPFFNKFIGVGFNEIYEVNKTAIDAYIYAHNDFINILVANGLIGLLMYVTSFFRFVKKSAKYGDNGFYITGAVVFTFLFNAIFNGQYNYPAAVFSVLFLFGSFEKMRYFNT